MKARGWKLPFVLMPLPVSMMKMGLSSSHSGHQLRVCGKGNETHSWLRFTGVSDNNAHFFLKCIERNTAWSIYQTLSLTTLPTNLLLSVNLLVCFYTGTHLLLSSWSAESELIFKSWKSCENKLTRHQV